MSRPVEKEISAQSLDELFTAFDLEFKRAKGVTWPEFWPWDIREKSAMEMHEALRDHVENALIEHGCRVEPCHLSSPRESILHVNYRDRKFAIAINEEDYDDGQHP